MSTIYADNIQPNLGSGVSIPGHVVQVVEASNETQISTTSTSKVSTGLSVSLTPASTSSKVLFSYTLAGVRKFGDMTIRFYLYRNGSQIVDLEEGLFDTSSSAQITDTIGNSYLDSPNSTSEVTYELYWNVSGGTAWVNVANWGRSSLTLMEIAQ